MTDQLPPRPRRRGIYLLPNLITTLALFFGFYAVVAAQSGLYESAAVGVFLAMVMDGIDGRVARLTNTQSDFGVQYDSIADMVSFGVAPALVVYLWALEDLSELGAVWDKLGWLGAFIYTACAGLRLARFNTQAGMADKRYFQGLPSPAAAATLAGMVWAGDRLEFGGWPAGLPALLIITLAGILMVSNVRYDSFKEIDFRYRVPFVVMVLGVLGVALMSVHPPTVLFALALTYMGSGPVLTVVRRRRRRRKRRQAG
ncbi:MAG: CDP-diacylglycerol--serine O-phosphatidyltransferase [Spiribacter sp.]|jgi:CDP-diacylglycerol--serine O-phosphatidyltransferase|nr:CDP-diacylglycerol--serine O-phosphatidyltransferase [Spiribacter sp.]MDR9489113.1 CDP-diacylglycerol--serine O-phosphatidyltransferase [Spiribacter sp.]